MDRDLIKSLSVAGEIRNQMFPSASAFLLAGSVVRGEATASSDLDLVVIFQRVERAKRQSFAFANWPVEAFIHDVQTLEYFLERWTVRRVCLLCQTWSTQGSRYPQKLNAGIW